MVSRFNPFIFFALLLSLIIIGCDSTSNVQSATEPGEKVSIRTVRVPYQASYGPKVTKNIMAGSLEQAPEKSFYIDKKDLPAPSSFGCIWSWINTDPTKDYKYLYHASFLYFSESLIQPANGRYKYVTTKALYSSGSEKGILGVRHCIVPYITGIDKLVESFVKIEGNQNTPNLPFTLKTTSQRYNWRK